MRALLSSLTVAAMFVHAALGCGWHNRHDCPRCDSLSGGASHGGSCGHHDDDHANCPAEPCKCQLECQDVCHYLPVEKTRIDLSRILFPVDFAVTTPLSKQSHRPNVSSGESQLGLFEPMPSVRVHLLHQILLI